MLGLVAPTLPPKPGVDLPAARETVPKPGVDLPAARETVPKPGVDLPAARETVPRPGVDLPAARETVPRPGVDLPAARETVPKPGVDLPAARETVPNPFGDLPTAAPAFDAPAAERDLPQSRGVAHAPRAVPQSGGGFEMPGAIDLMGAFEMSTPAAPPAPVAAPAPGLDLFLGELPLGGPAPAAQAAPPLDLGAAFAPPPASRPPDSVSLDLDFPSLGDLPAPDPLPPPPFDQGGPTIMTGAPGSFDLDLDPALAGLAAPPPGPIASPGFDPAAAAPAPPPRPPLEVGFSFELEGSAAEQVGAAVLDAAALRGGAPRPDASAPDGDDLPTDVPRLAPPKRRQAARTEAPKAPRGTRTKLFVGVGLVLVLGAGAAVFGLPALRRGPGIATVLAPFEAELARDHLPAYQRAAEALETEAGTEGARPELRAAQAEVLLLSVLGRGADRARVARAEQALSAAAAPEPAPPVFARARALVAIARNRGREVDGLLGAEAETAPGQLVQGLRRLAENKPELAVGLLQKAASGSGTLGTFLLARALEEQGKRPEALAAYRKVLEKNAAHGGAQVALVRLSDEPAEKRLAAALALLPRIGANASPGEQADAHVILGLGLLASGRTLEAIEKLSRAVTLNGQNVAAQIALGEALLVDGRYADAQGRFRAPGPAAMRDPRVRLGLGSALIGLGQVAEGRGLVAQAMTELPSDGRGDYFLAFAEEKKLPADLDAAIAGYRKALAANPRHLPAALRLAALLQSKGQAEEAVGVLQKAKQIGAPAEALDLAWGEALVAAKQATKGEEVFRQALARNGKLGPARVGLASALLAQGKLDEAQAELERCIAEAPDTADVRRRLADLLAQRGKKPEALARLEEDVATGKASPTTRTALGKLALELNRLDRAVVVLEGVLSDEPATPEAAFTLARVREAQGELPRALTDYRRALAFENTPAVHLAYGRALVRVAREEDAQREFEAAGDAPGAHLELGRLRMRRNDLDGALRAFEAEAKVSPHDGDAHLQRGLVLDKLGQAEAAADAWRAALRAEPGFVIARYHLGRFEMDRGKPRQAIDYLRAAVAKSKALGAWEAEAYFQLGQAELAAGSRSAAAAAFRKFLDLAPPEAPARPEAQTQLQRLSGK